MWEGGGTGGRGCVAHGEIVLFMLKYGWKTLKEKTNAKPHAYVPCTYERRVLPP